MKKRIVKILFCLLAGMLLSTGCFAAETESLETFSGADRLWDALPEGVDENAVRSLLEEEQPEGFIAKIWEILLSLITLGIRSGTEFFLKICGLLLFAALFRTVKDSFGIQGMESAFDFLIMLCLSLISFSALQEGIGMANVTMEGIQAFFLASLPITTILLTLSGSPNAASALSSTMSFSLGAVTTFVTSSLSPMMNTLFAFSMLDGILDGGMASLLAFFKKCAKVLCVLFFTLISAALSLKNALATAADSLAMRSVRFAAGNFIPIVGSLVGESAKTVAASFAVVKTECGVLCIVVLLYVILRPILYLTIRKFFLSLAAAFSEIVGEKSFQRYFTSIASLMELLMALLISEGIYLIFYITLFLSNKGSF